MQMALCTYNQYILYKSYVSKVIVSSNTTKNKFVLDDGIIVPSGEEHIVSGITIDSRLTFYSHFKQSWKKVANNLNNLTRIGPYINHNQWRIILSSFLTGQSSYCPFHGHSAPDNQIISETNSKNKLLE